VPVEFDIWGTIEDEEYWRSCQASLERLPAHVRVEYKGPAKHNQIPDVLPSYDLMFLPSLGENYGHVIAESLVAGTPVLISDRTPWRNLAEHGVGWDLPIEAGAEPFHEAMKQALKRKEKEGVTWHQQVRSYAAALLTPELIDANRRLLRLTGKHQTAYEYEPA
jgi:glycosyltransferase involved in cell wall biosynthesis